MEEVSYIVAILTGAFYLVASQRLLRLSWRTGQRPELWLGIMFAGTGQWFVIYNLPYFFGLVELPTQVENWVEWVYAISVIPYLLFIRLVFRPKSSWATALTGVSTLFLLAGAGIAGLHGQFLNDVDEPAYLLEWIGYTIPCVWMYSESHLSHASAQKRVRMGLCSPIVANRYLLFAGFSFCQSIACLVDLLWAWGRGVAGADSAYLVGLLAATESTSIVFLWLAFFPPRFYRRWIDSLAELDVAEEGHS